VSEGTTLTLRLPRGNVEDIEEDGAPSVLWADSKSFEADWSKRKVLVVDDDEFSRLLVTRHLPTPPFELHTANNGAKGLERFMELQPDWVILDMEMPIMGGIEAAKAMRAHEAQAALGRRAVILMLSSNDEAQATPLAEEAGCDLFLSKPVSREHLLGVMLRMGGPRPAERREHAVASALFEVHPASVATIDRSLEAQLPAFIASRMEILELLLTAIDAKDPAATRQHAHKCAGGLAMYGFDWAAKQARQIETTAPLQEWAAMRTLALGVREHLSTVHVEFVDSAN
jgi:CheY-like chemotaxis protein